MSNHTSILCTSQPLTWRGFPVQKILPPIADLFLLALQRPHRLAACGSESFLVEQDNQYGRASFDCLITGRDNLIEPGYQDWFNRD